MYGIYYVSYCRLLKGSAYQNSIISVKYAPLVEVIGIFNYL
jgi:hypothetical protein